MDAIAKEDAEAPDAARHSRVLTLADGRQLGYAEYGDPHGLPLLALHGTPEVKANLQATFQEGLRPGIAGSQQDLSLFCGPWGFPLEAIDVPALLWQGSADTVVPPDAAYHLARRLPHCRFEVIPAAGHYWGFGQFDTILGAVAAALRPA